LTPLEALVHRTGNWIIIATQVILLSVAALFLTRKKAEMSSRYGGVKLSQ
jgi:membrane-associated PAP2 superfamily phosphatase